MADSKMTTFSRSSSDSQASSSQESTSNVDQLSERASSLDHALLESLFYNEMMLMDTDLLSYLSNNGTNESRPLANTTTATEPTVDPSTLVERDLLRDFGVASLPTSMELQDEPLHNGIASHGWPMLLDPLPQQQQQQQLAPPVAPAVSATTHSTVPLTSRLSPIPQTLSASTPTASTTTTATITTPPASGGLTNSTTAVKQLVSQFATLASRLGIELPQDVLQSLITTASSNEPNGLPPTMTTVSLEAATNRLHLGSYPSSPDVAAIHHRPANHLPYENSYNTTMFNGAMTAENLLLPEKSSEPVFPRSLSAPILPRLLEDTMTTVSLKRSWSGEETNSVAGTSSPNNIDDDKHQQLHQQPPYSKRRKKANLSDCEARLAALKAENEMLKRHLHTVSNQTHKIDQERRNTAVEMRRLLAAGATPEQIDAVVDRFSETYSDYGRHRHQELNFHLDQLQRLATPSNFTKMGLWTLGQTGSKGKNPLAGILQRDLGITPPQGRKILEQRQKIRDVCSNLKECLALLAKLKTLCEGKTRIFHDRMNKAREILNPMQVVRLLIWIDEHSSLVAQLCPGWGSEHIVGAKKGTDTNNKPNSTTTPPPL